MSCERKFCKDCKHFKAYPSIPIPMPWGQSIGGYDRCEHPSLVNLVYGAQISVDPAERRQRGSVTGCGYDGMQFEAGAPTPGILQPMFDLQKEAARMAEHMQKEYRSPTGQHVKTQPRPWWRFWQ